MTDQAPTELPFRVEYREDTREVVVWMTFGTGPKQTLRRKAISSLEELAVAVAEHHHEAFLQSKLSQTLAKAAVDHLGADPGRLWQAVRELSNPASTVPLGAVLHGTQAGPGPAPGGRNP